MRSELLLPERYADAVAGIAAEMRSEMSSLYEMRLFGSCSKNSYNALSDIDILIITKETLTDRVYRAFLREKIDAVLEKYGLEADVVFYSLDSYLNDESAFTKNLRESVLLLEGGEKIGL